MDEHWRVWKTCAGWFLFGIIWVLSYFIISTSSRSGLPSREPAYPSYELGPSASLFAFSRGAKLVRLGGKNCIESSSTKLWLPLPMGKLKTAVAEPNDMLSLALLVLIRDRGG